MIKRNSLRIAQEVIEIEIEKEWVDCKSISSYKKWHTGF